MSKQSLYDRLKRLSVGRCPIHGTFMPQSGLNDDKDVFLVSCPRKDCGISGYTLDCEGPVHLFDSHVLNSVVWHHTIVAES